MKRENLTALAKKVMVKTLTKGRALFSQGDTDKHTLWLISEHRGLTNERARPCAAALPRAQSPSSRSCRAAPYAPSGSYLSIDSVCWTS